ncbi:MAG: hypothetical protein LBG58_02930 [Planctomycetaceae bacterium]|jgi:uncharacterized repeat protein (TIGR04138 family)|nr:hypothetical protein [Planctomycetaceae bacterium]
MSLSTTTPFIELLKRDRRYKAEAYAFVYEALNYAQNILGLGQEEKNESVSEEILIRAENTEAENTERGKTTEIALANHITGQELCQAAREYAIIQYGFLAQTVLDSIGIRKTDDIGEIVYNLINIGQMRKTPQDSREDFNNVFDFETAFGKTYRIHSGTA